MPRPVAVPRCSRRHQNEAPTALGPHSPRTRRGDASCSSCLSRARGELVASEWFDRAASELQDARDDLAGRRRRGLPLPSCAPRRRRAAGARPHAPRGGVRRGGGGRGGRGQGAAGRVRRRRHQARHRRLVLGRHHLLERLRVGRYVLCLPLCCCSSAEQKACVRAPTFPGSLAHASRAHQLHVVLPARKQYVLCCAVLCVSCTGGITTSKTKLAGFPTSSDLCKVLYIAGAATSFFSFSLACQ